MIRSKISLLALPLVLLGCSSEDVADAEAAAHEAVESAASAVERATELGREAEGAFVRLNADLDELGDRIEHLAKEGEAEISARVAEAGEEYRRLEARLARLAEDSGEDVDEARRAIREEMEELRDEVREIEVEVDVEG